MARIIYKSFRHMANARKELAKMEKMGLNAAMTDSKFISGHKKGTDVYAVSGKTIKGFHTKHLKMVYE